MKLSVDTFKGEAPRLSPRLLPPGAAQEATNCRMESGDLQPFRQFASEKVLAAAATTIYRLNGSWLSWNAQVDAARGLIPGDTNYFLFLTSPTSGGGLYTTPRYTTYALSTTGAEPFPVETRPLGMPAPTDAPEAVAGVATGGGGTVIDVLDSGLQLATWIVSPPVSGGGFGTGASLVSETVPIPGSPDRYVIVIDGGGDNNFRSGYFYKDFGIGESAAIEYSTNFQMHGAVDSDVRQAIFHVANPADGNGLVVWYDNTLGDGLLKFGSNSGGWTHTGTIGAATPIGTINVGTLARNASKNAQPYDPANWYKLKVVVSAPSEVQVTVTVTLYDGFDGTTELGTQTETGAFLLGPYCGQANAWSYDSNRESSWCQYTSISVQASGTRGAVIVNTATSYVYTFINDNVGDAGVTWESAPSPASSTLLRQDGVSVTVTTATTHAYDAAYGINKKRIYRAVSGATGDIYLLVTEIPLATADYEDTLDDATISTPGTPLESEDWDLPPANMQGIISLPNNMMAGFFANQLCLSAVGHPHAWPVKYRLTTETDIVAIANIDNVIVIGTKSRVQTAAGNDPANYSMSQPGEAQACVSKRSMVYLDGYGVVFASPDGYQVCAGSAGNVKNATEGLFTKQQWQALKPATIIAAVYDGVLYFWYDST